MKGGFPASRHVATPDLLFTNEILANITKQSETSKGFATFTVA
jgi:hypothetical protein